MTSARFTWVDARAFAMALFERIPGAAIVLLVAVASAWALWPDPSSPVAIVPLVVFCVALALFMSPATLGYTTTSFIASAAAAFLVHSVTAPKGYFVTDYQEGLVTDSQYFLYLAQEFRRTPSVDALTMTWGSPAPVLFGGLALWLFGNSFIGVVLLNAVLYGMSVRIIALQRDRDGRAPTYAGMLASALPLQALYNSMLAKEPIYLFLCCLSVHLIGRVAQRVSVGRNSSVLFALLLLLLLFRPVGSLILSAVALVSLFRNRQRRVLLGYGAVAVAAALAVAGIAFASGLRIPLFFLTSEGAFSFQEQLALAGRYASEKEAVGSFAPLLTPPLSVLMAPILSLPWLIAPFPLLGPSIGSAASLLSFDFTFQDVATVARGLDSLALVVVLGMLFRQWRAGPRELARQVLNRPILLFTALSVLGIAAFQFIESGRHRYSVTPVLLLFALLQAPGGARSAQTHPTGTQAAV